MIDKPSAIRVEVDRLHDRAEIDGNPIRRADIDILCDLYLLQFGQYEDYNIDIRYIRPSWSDADIIYILFYFISAAAHTTVLLTSIWQPPRPARGRLPTPLERAPLTTP